MKTAVLLCVSILLITGCASSRYTTRYQEIENLYSSGKITSEEYLRFKQNLAYEEMLYRQNLARAFAQLGQDNSVQTQRTYSNTMKSFMQPIDQTNTVRVKADCYTNSFGNTQCY